VARAAGARSFPHTDFSARRPRKAPRLLELDLREFGGYSHEMAVMDMWIRSEPGKVCLPTPPVARRKRLPLRFTDLPRPR